SVAATSSTPRTTASSPPSPAVTSTSTPLTPRRRHAVCVAATSGLLMTAPVILTGPSSPDRGLGPPRFGEGGRGPPRVREDQLERGRAVDLLADDVGVAGVPGQLLDEVHMDVALRGRLGVHPADPRRGADRDLRVLLAGPDPRDDLRSP